MVQRIQTFDIPGGGICHCTRAEFEKLLDSLPETRYNEASRAETPMIKEVTKYVTSDGKEFDTKAEANKYLETSEGRKQNLLDKFYKTYYSDKLMREHSLEEEGLWRVQGEDPNCDLGGAHYMPELGNYAGKLKNVIEIAVTLPGFWQWGSGGKITKLAVTPV